MTDRKTMLIIRLPYYLGIVADALWAVALLIPQVYGLLTGNPDYSPDLETRLIMAIGGTLMAGWTILLIWALQNPIERRFIILITAFPVVFGMFIISLTGYLDGNNSGIWLVAKTVILMLTMFYSYILAGKRRRE